MFVHLLIDGFEISLRTLFANSAFAEFRIFQGLFTVQLSRFLFNHRLNVQSKIEFICWLSFLVLSDSLYSISPFFSLVNNFFIFLSTAKDFLRRWNFIIASLLVHVNTYFLNSRIFYFRYSLCCNVFSNIKKTALIFKAVLQQMTNSSPRTFLIHFAASSIYRICIRISKTKPNKCQSLLQI